MAISMQTVSKTQLKSQLLVFLRAVEKNKEPLIITHQGKPVVKISPYKKDDPEKELKKLRGSVLYYKDPLEPVGLEDWELLP